jgi:hypothetical protein
MKRALLTGFLLFAAAQVSAHEVRPAYLEIREERAGEFSVLWKTPAKGDLRLALTPEFSGDIELLTPIISRAVDGAVIQTWRMRAAQSLRGESIRIAGLEGTMTDTIIRIDFADGKTWNARATPGEPIVPIPEALTGTSVAIVYTKLGIEHIFIGIDHLLFVAGLLLLVPGFVRLAKTISAFTVAHTVTLSLASLGYVHLPPPPVEAMIALSIVFVAREIILRREGAPSLTERQPWVVAFAFGLLHGLGFAGGLSEAGLPEDNIPLALLFFSVGVEIAHFLFISFWLVTLRAARIAQIKLPAWQHRAPPYAIGALAVFWLIQRVASF